MRSSFKIFEFSLLVVTENAFFFKRAGKSFLCFKMEEAIKVAKKKKVFIFCVRMKRTTF